MHAVDRPAIMNFEVPDLMKQRVTISDKLPEPYSKYRIPGTVVHTTEGPFGAFFKQELRTDDWIVGWLNFDIKEHTFLYPITRDPLLALYTGINGNIPCELQGSAEKLMLPEKKFAFYYVPPMAFNRAEFAPAHYTAVYISFSPSFMQYFGNKYEAYKPLVEKQLRGEQEGEQKNLIPLGNTARDIIQAMGSYRQAPAMFEPYLHGQVMLLTAHYFNLLMDRHEVPKTVLDACDFIQCNLTEDIDTAFIARKAGTHKDALNKQFKEVYGKNVRQYITHVRLEEAEYRLLNTNELIWEIAAHANLTDASHLVRLIRGKHGLTPEEFREKHR
ncbi:helix-turn-helix domain-containing protein [Chitinophaga sp. GCM10012297]|uniref:Helix-turn-helix transcriptional regulator n=1 Tax=Chitinophaga chungangae TaxID=2821488 RepID=A0ABS3YIL5_9BACT|nr:AraC family transcriptional regulator [Chitinophaga chungangae]MBO9154531.1 helix-turn-helix transcriptional regulator [Chitinophaga chungangae]